MTTYTMNHWVRLTDSAALLVAASSAVAAEESKSDPISATLLSRVASKDLSSIRELRTRIYDHACESNVMASLTILATNAALEYESIDLIVHAAIFCPEKGGKLFEVMLSNLNLTNVQLTVVQTLISFGMYGFKKTNHIERVVAFCNGLNEGLEKIADSTSDDEIRSWIASYRRDRNPATRKKILETLSFLAKEDRRSFGFEVATDMVELDPDDPYLRRHVGTIRLVQDRPEDALEMLRPAWLDKRYIGALDIYASALRVLHSRRSDNQYEPEIRAVISDLLRFQRFNPRFSVSLMFLGANLSTDSPENQKLMKQVLEEINEEVLLLRPQLRKNLEQLISRWK